MSSRLAGTSTLLSLRATFTGDVSSGRQKLEKEIISLFDQLRDPLLRYLSGLGIALPDGEEVIQEAFLLLFQHLRAGKPRDNLRGWMFRVSHNLALKQRYRERRSPEAPTMTGVFEGVAIDPAPSTEDQLVSNVTQQRLMAVIDALPEQDRKCLLLRAEGLRYREIAEILDMSLGALSVSLTRSLARIVRATQR